MKPAFHEGELAAQRLAGRVAAGHGIRDFMLEQHRAFFAALPFLLAAGVGPDGAPSAQVLHGAPGFATSPDPLTLELACETAFEAGAPLGLLGIDFATRRRNRANGVVRANANGKLVVTVRESFGNCPKHICVRDVTTAPPGTRAPFAFDGLDPAARALVAGADTFFVATSGGTHGVDMSHRGGPAGFVRIEGDIEGGIEGETLVVPDYDGNRYFNTLGNLLLDPRAALLLIDFATGDVLTLRGSVTIAWRDGAREWRFSCAGGKLARAALPLRWTSR